MSVWPCALHVMFTSIYLIVYFARQMNIPKAKMTIVIPSSKMSYNPLLLAQLKKKKLNKYIHYIMFPIYILK